MGPAARGNGYRHKVFCPAERISVRDHMPFLMFIFHESHREPTTTTAATTKNPPTHVRIAACSYVHTWAHTVFWRCLAANSLVELEAEHSLYTWGVGWGKWSQAFPYVGPCFSIPPQRVCAMNHSWL